jgi:cytochrome c biogenesis protein ResB
MSIPARRSQDRLGQLLHQAWRITIWPETAMIVLTLLLAATLVGGLLPQMAAGAKAGSPAQARWLDQAHVHWGVWANRLAEVGLAQFYTGRIFRVLLALIAALAALWALRLWIPAWRPRPDT